MILIFRSFHLRGQSATDNLLRKYWVFIEIFKNQNNNFWVVNFKKSQIPLFIFWIFRCFHLRGYSVNYKPSKKTAKLRTLSKPLDPPPPPPREFRTPYSEIYCCFLVESSKLGGVNYSSIIVLTPVGNFWIRGSDNVQSLEAFFWRASLRKRWIFIEILKNQKKYYWSFNLK